MSKTRGSDLCKGDKAMHEGEILTFKCKGWGTPPYWITKEGITTCQGYEWYEKNDKGIYMPVIDIGICLEEIFDNILNSFSDEELREFNDNINQGYYKETDFAQEFKNNFKIGNH